MGLVVLCVVSGPWGCAASRSDPASDVTPVLSLPARAADAPGGAAFAEATAKLDGQARQAAAVAQVLAGNVPSWLRRLAAVSLETPQGPVTLYMTPDYVAIGSDADFLRMPLTLPAAASLCRATGCLLPTPAMVDAAYAQAALQLQPQPIPPSDRMTSNEVFLQHQLLVQAQLDSIDGGHERLASGALTAGHKKDVVLTQGLANRPGRVAIYGWHRPDRRPIQPLSMVHDDQYADYSHGARLVHGMAMMKGEARKLSELLADAVIGPALTGAAPLRVADVLP